LDDYALAARLSYFFWRTMPDQKLLDLAGQKKLRSPEELRLQVERMLQDPKSAASSFGSSKGTLKGLETPSS